MKKNYYYYYYYYYYKISAGYLQLYGAWGRVVVEALRY